MTGYPCEWLANSSDEANRSGVGKFMVDGVEYRFPCNDFADFHRIGAALDAAFQQGRKFGMERGCDLMRRAIRELGETP